MVLFLLLILLVITLSIPSVQTKIAQKVTQDLNETYGTDIQIGRLGLNWKGEVDIREVLIRDHREDTLIYSQYLQTNILSVQKLIQGNLDFGFIDLENAKLYVTTYKNEDDDNLSIFSQKFNTGDTTQVKPFELLSNDLTLQNTRVKITDENLETPTVLDVQNIQLDAEDFKVYDSDVAVNINSLAFLEASGIEVEDLVANFAYTPTQMVLGDLKLKTANSLLQGDVSLEYENGMSDFENDVIIRVDFNNSSISTNDLNKFYPEFGKDLDLQIDGKFSGTLNNFTFSDASLAYSNSNFTGSYTFKNLFSDGVYAIQANNHSIKTNYFDLRRILPNIIGNDLPEELKPFGDLVLQGTTQIEGDFIKTNSKLNSAIGKATVDAEMGNVQDFKNAYYKGKIDLQKFNLGKIAGTTSLETIDAKLYLDGRGFTAETVSTQVDGKISSIIFEGYNYKNIIVKGNLKNPLFNGQLTIDDPNLQMVFDGLVDVSKQQNHYDFEADIEFAELNKLNLFKRDSVSVFAGKIKMNMDGTSINDAVGTINFTETFYQTSQKDFFFDDFAITSSYSGDERTIEINSPDIINGRIRGKFLVEDIPYLFRNSIGSIYTNYIPVQVTTDQYLNYEFEVYNKIVDVFIPQLQLGENTRVRGSVYSDESKFQLDFKSPELLLYENYLGKVNVQLDNDNPLFNAYISVDSLYNGSYNLTDINVINKTLKDTLYVQSKFVGGVKQQKDTFNLALYHTINPEGNSVVGIKKSLIKYQGNDWYLNRNNNNLNKLTFDDNFRDIKLDSLTLSHNNEFIQMAGVKQDSSLLDVELQFTDVDIGKLLPAVDSLNLKGKINGGLELSKKGNSYYPVSDVVIEDIYMNDIAFGNLELYVKGNSDLTSYQINSNLINENVTSFKAIGELDVSGEDGRINLDVSFNDFNLEAFSPLGADVISNLRGFVNGNTKIKGNYKSPDLSGSLVLRETGLTVPYLNVDFDLQDNTPVFISKNKFQINPITITDTKYNTQGTLSGSFSHNNFGEWGMDIGIDTDRLLVLDTPADEDALYYGTAFISGESTIKGPVDELVIDVFATTEEGTSFKIPISDAASIGDDSFIRFISPEEKKARINGETYIPNQVKGLSLNFELDINKSAEVEVLVDQVNNSVLKGRGAGILLLEINTLGKFRMWGDFLIIEGQYDFRYGGLVDKTIDVVPGGNITWDGEPTKANLDLTARYSVENVNPSSLLDNPNLNSTVDVEVLLNLTGEIMQPDLEFNFNFPGVSSAVKSELEDRLRTKEQRELQGIWLAATGSFQGQTATQTALASTLTERVNKLVADIFADSDSKFKVLPTVSTRRVSLDEQLEYQVGVQLSSKISERVLINGKVGVPVNGANESTVAGDIEVQWLVNEDGSLRINFFNRQADLQFIGEDLIFEQGGGVSYSVDFDTMKELMQKLFNKKLTLEKEKAEQIEINQDDSIMPAYFDNNSSGTKEEEQELP